MSEYSIREAQVDDVEEIRCRAPLNRAYLDSCSKIAIDKVAYLAESEKGKDL